MVARAVEDAGRRLQDLRREEWQDYALAAVTLGLAVTASVACRALALPLFVGGLFATSRAILAGWRRWDLLDRLVVERDAYAIPEVRARADQEATMASGGEALERADRDRRPGLVVEDAGALAEDLDRADARAGSAEQVLLEDRPGSALRIAVGQLRDKGRNVDPRRAGDRARRRRVGAAALQAAVSLEDRAGAVERRAELLEQPLRLSGKTHVRSLAPRV
jgi:hypothetical protein